jgi:lysophospholipase L1-like esterase
MYPHRVKHFLPPGLRVLPSLLICLLTASSLLFAQHQTAQPVTSPQDSFYLHDGDTVVFYGDSITEQSFYTRWIELYTATRFPHMQVQFFNEGNGGDRVTGGSAGPVDQRLTRDVFPLKPSVVTIMLGMNDGGYKPLDPETENRYTQGYEHILSSVQQALPSARITLFGPSPYDEVTRPPKFPGGYNPSLTRFAEVDSDLARKHNATFIDLNPSFVAALKRGVAINPLATEILLPDRVHPEALAHWFMAQAALKGWNAPAIVSSTTIDIQKQVALDLVRAHVTDLTSSDTSAAWTELDDALPLPFDQANAGVHFLHQLIDLDTDLDQQPLKVLGLKQGSYQLSIDGLPTGIFTDAELTKGINLASMNTPMVGQAYPVEWQIRDRDVTNFIRLRMFVHQFKDGVPAEPGATDLLKFESDQQKLIYELAQPKPHKFLIKAIATPQ